MNDARLDQFKITVARLEAWLKPVKMGTHTRQVVEDELDSLKAIIQAEEAR